MNKYTSRFFKLPVIIRLIAVGIPLLFASSLFTYWMIFTLQTSAITSQTSSSPESTPSVLQEAISIDEVESVLGKELSVKHNDGTYELTEAEFDAYMQSVYASSQTDNEKYAKSVQKQIKENAPDELHDRLLTQEYVSSEKGGRISVDGITIDIPAGVYSEDFIVSYKDLTVSDKNKQDVYSRVFEITAVTLSGTQIDKFDGPSFLTIDTSEETSEHVDVFSFDFETGQWKSLQGALLHTNLKAHLFEPGIFAAGIAAPQFVPPTNCGLVIDNSDPSPCTLFAGTYTVVSVGDKGNSYISKHFTVTSAWSTRSNDGSDIGLRDVYTHIPDPFLTLGDTVKYYVYTKTGAQIITVNQELSKGGSVLLGQFEFGSVATVEIYYPGNGNDYAIADSIYLQEPGVSPIIDSTPPTISNASVSSANLNLYVQAHVTDDNSGVASVYAVVNNFFNPMSANGNDYSFNQVFSQNQAIDVIIAAYDNAGNESLWVPGRGAVSRATLGRELGIPPWLFYSTPTVPNFDVQGHNPESNPCEPMCGDPVNTTTGNFYLQHPIISITGRPSIDLFLNYNSQGTGLSVFGENWTHAYNYHLSSLGSDTIVSYPDGRQIVFSGASLTPEPGNFESLIKTGSGWELEKKDTSKVFFDSFGDVSRIQDSNGNGLNFAYQNQQTGNNLSQLTSITADGGRSLTLDYHGNGLVSHVYAPDGKTIEFGYTGDNLTSITDARGNTEQFTYQGFLLTSRTAPEGNPYFVNTYDREFRVTHQKVGETAEYSFDYQLNSTIVTDITGKSKTYRYTEDKLFTSMTDESGNTTSYEYTSQKQMNKMTDGEGHTFTYQYDQSGDLLIETDPLQKTINRTYDQTFHHVTSERYKMDDHLTTYTYDNHGNLLSIINAENKKAIFEYNEFGQLIQYTDFNGNSTFYRYNSSGDLEEMQDAYEKSELYEYDGLGRKTARIDKNLNRYEYAYDGNDNLTDIFGPINYHISFSYDKNNNTVRATDANGGVETFVYDDSENIVEQKDQLGNITTYSFGLMNELSTMTDPLQRVMQYAYTNTYTSQGVTQAVGLPESVSYSSTLNKARIETDRTDPEGRFTHMSYDPLYRITESIENYKPNQTATADTNVTTSYQYSETGALKKTIDPDGNATFYTLDKLDRVTKVVDAENNSTHYTYDGNGNVTSITNPRGYKTTYIYDKLNRLIEVKDANDKSIHYEYDAVGNLISTTNKNDVVTKHEYDALSRLVKKIENYQEAQESTSETNLTTEYIYDLAGNLTSIKNPRGFTTTFTYDKAHRLTEITDAHNKKTSIIYDTVGNMRTITDRNGNVSETQYDGLNRIIAEINAEQEKLSYTYTKTGQIETLTDPKLNTYTYGYDALDRLTSVTDPLTATSIYTYDANGNTLKFTDANLHATTYVYDDINRLLNISNPEQEQTSYEYDRNGNILEVYDPEQNRTTFIYDKLDRLTEQVDSYLNEKNFSYDNESNLISLIDENNHTTTYAYDRLNRQISMTDPEELVTTYAYDANGNRTSMFDANHIETQYNYDELDRLNLLIEAATADGDISNERRETHYEYDNENNLTVEIAADGVKTHYQFDSVYRLTAVIENAVDGQLSAEKSDADSRFHGNDNGDNVSVIPAETLPAGHTGGISSQESLSSDVNIKTSYTYDDNGNLDAITDPRGNKTQFSYTSRNELESETDPLGNITRYGYDIAGNQILRIDGNNQRTQYSYAPDNMLAAILYGNSSVLYQYDKNNNPTAMQDSLGTTLWNYDDLNRLTSTTDSLGRTIGYAYDHASNLASETYPDGRSLSYNYLDNNWLSDITDPQQKITHYEYDNVGNIRLQQNPNGTSTDTKYDNLNRPVEIINFNKAHKKNTHIHYQYDEVGNRNHVETKYINGSPSTLETDYAYDPLRRLVHEEDNTGRYAAYTYDGAGNREMYETSNNRSSQTSNDVELTISKFNAANELEQSGIYSATQSQESGFVSSFKGTLNNLENNVKKEDGKKISEEAADYMLGQIGKIQEQLERQPLHLEEIAVLLLDLKSKTQEYIDNGAIEKKYGEKLMTDINTLGKKRLDYQTKYTTATTYTHDNNGNRTSASSQMYNKKFGVDYSYDQENRLISAQDFDVNSSDRRTNRDSSTMQYDGNGRRLAREYHQTPTSSVKRFEYTFNNLDPIAIYDIQAKKHENLYRGADNNITQSQFVSNNSNSSGTRTFYHYDALGSVVGRTNSSGSSDKTYRYESFGSDYSNNPTTTGSIYNIGFTGEEFNEQAGVYEFYSRAYDPTTGTWLQRDKYRGEIEVPQSLHGYAYVMNGPVKYADAYGFYKKCNYFDPVCNSQNGWEFGLKIVQNGGNPDGVITVVNEFAQDQESSNSTIQAIQYASWYKMTDTADGTAQLAALTRNMSLEDAENFTKLHNSLFGPCGSYKDKSYLTDDWYNGFFPGASNIGYLTDPTLSYEDKVFIGTLATYDSLEIASLMKGAYNLGSKGLVKVGKLFGREGIEEAAEHTDDLAELTDDLVRIGGRAAAEGVDDVARGAKGWGSKFKIGDKAYEFTDHGWGQMIRRGLEPADVQNAIKTGKSIKYTNKIGPVTGFRAADGTFVAVGDDGKIITVIEDTVDNYLQNILDNPIYQP